MAAPMPDLSVARPDTSTLPREREVEMAEFETRIRKFVLDLMEPTIHKASQQQLEIDNIRASVEKHAKSINDVMLMSVKAEQQISVVEHFREEMSKWDVQRRSQEAKVAEDIAFMKHELDGFRYNLERKESAINALQRTVDRLVGEMHRLQDSQDQLRKYCEDRIDTQSKAINNARTDIEVKLIALETKHNSLADELWGEETGLAKVQGDLSKTNGIVMQLSDEMKKVQKNKAAVTHLERVQEEVNELIREASSNVTALKQTVGNVVNDVKEHFRTASNTIAAHNATMIAEVRSSYQEELNHSAKLRSEVMKFMQETQENITHLEGVVQVSREQTEALVKEVRLEVEDLNKKRKRDKANGDIESKALKKRLAGVFETSELVMKSMEHLTGVMGVLVESNRVQACLEIQDDTDRRKVALMGYKEMPGGHHTGSKGKKLPTAGNRDPPVIGVDNRCLSCSGQAATVLAGFKIACLQYKPAPVKYMAQTYERHELLQIRHDLLEQAHEQIQGGPDGLRKLGKPDKGLDHMSDIIQGKKDESGMGGGGLTSLPTLAQQKRSVGNLTAR
mmetsp:Transcript_6004/g.14338  ORF Transcript_6004/g.14338 Transcript_6004/m.14338 type:complete len:564 (+) Transcript_6004:67-1758(+)